MCCRICSFVLTTAGMWLVGMTSCCAQGLIFSLPEDRTGVEYEGTVTQETVRPELEAGRKTLTWTRELSIKSVGREDAEFSGKVQSCRWIEIRVVTGTKGVSGIDAGPVGARIYKVLVPESKVIDTAVDADTIPNSVLPIVKGYRRLGEEQIEPLHSRGLVVYPTLCLLENYKSPSLVSGSASIENVSGNETYECRHLKGRNVRERTESRSTNDGEFWLSEDVPFGLAGWSVTVTRESKGSAEDRARFRQIGSVTSEMRLRRIVRTAESELITD